MAEDWTPAFVNSEEERRGGGGSTQYLNLVAGEKFMGYPLFEGDPKKPDPAYQEYLEHYLNDVKKRVVCAGPDKCPLCHDGDKPKTRAKTVWLVTVDENGNELNGGEGEIRVFTMNYHSLITAFGEMRTENDKFKGRLFRVTLNDDRGNYSIFPKTETITATQIKELIKTDGFPDLKAMLTAQLRKAMGALTLSKALEEDDTPDEETAEEQAAAPAKATKSAPAKAAPAKAAKVKAWPDEAEDMVVEVAIVNDENTIEVTADGYDGQVLIYGTNEATLTELEVGTSIKIDYLTDSDNDKVIGAFEAVEDEPEEQEVEEEVAADADAPDATDGDDLPATIEDEVYTVVVVNAKEETLDVTNGEYAFTLYFLTSGPASAVDFDDYEAGAKISLSATKDSDNDMVATAVPTPAKAAPAKAAAGTKRKGG